MVGEKRAGVKIEKKRVNWIGENEKGKKYEKGSTEGMKEKKEKEKKKIIEWERRKFENKKKEK